MKNVTTAMLNEMARVGGAAIKEYRAAKEASYMHVAFTLVGKFNWSAPAAIEAATQASRRYMASTTHSLIL